MGNPLHLRRTPTDLAEDGQLIEFAAKVEDFERLEAIAAADLAALDSQDVPVNWRSRAVSGALRFGFAAAQARIPVLSGELAATLDMVCQRCLQPVPLALSSELRLRFDGEQALVTDAATYEVWELDDAVLDLAELVEEALIMALPLVAMHGADTRCGAAAVAAAPVAKKNLPFANLKAQMKQEQ